MSDKGKTTEELREMLNMFIDELETKYGDITGFEVKIKHDLDPTALNGRSYGKVEEFVLRYDTRTQISELENNE